MAKKKVVKKEDKKEKKVAAKKDTKKEVAKKKKDKFDKLVEELEIEADFVETEIENNKDFFEEGEEEIEDIEEEDDDEDAYEEVVSSKNKNANNSDKNQKSTYIFITCVSLCISVVSLFISLIILNKVSYIHSFYVEDDEQQVETSYDTSMFTSVTEDDFIALFEEEDLKDDEVRFVFSGRSTCSYCVAFLPFLQQSVEEYNYTLYYLDIDTVSKYDEISELDEGLAENISYTPMVYAVKNGEVIDINDGYTEYSTLTQFLEDNGVEKK